MALTKSEWDKINAELAQNPSAYGFPERDDQSLLIGSFNIRKLGTLDNRNEHEWEFLTNICSQFDLLAVQEVMDKLDGIKHLKQQLHTKNPKFRMLLSDATGTFPGESGLSERLCFLYNLEHVRRDEVVSDITYDRSKLMATLYENMDDLNAAFEDYKKKMDSFNMELRKSKPNLKIPVFLSFIRQPYCVAFRLGKESAANPYEVMAVNAHLLFGNYMSDRELEFKALMEWIIERVKQDNKTYYDNFLLLGDLNLNFDNPARDIAKISDYMKTFDADSGDEFDVNFPFLDVHPTQTEVWRTNARKSETFDHIGLFFNDSRFPNHTKNENAGSNGYDYQVFDFVSLFAKATLNKTPQELTSSEKKAFYKKFEHKVSDHMPIWMRIPLPD